MASTTAWTRSRIRPKPSTNSSLLLMRRSCQLPEQNLTRLGERGSVPGQMPTRHERAPVARERFGTVVGGEGVRLVRQYDKVHQRHRLEIEPRIALGMRPEAVVDSEPA